MTVEKLISELEKEISEFPQGRLQITHCPKFQYYRVLNGKLKYIRKSDKDLISSLAQKSYDKTILKMLKKKVLNINELGLVYDLLGSERKKLVKPRFISDSLFAENWLRQKPVQKDVTSYKTDNNEFVKSKSELIIANKLFAAKIPYIYEKPLTLADRVIYPDFTILIPNTRSEVIWEHFGMMGDSNYRRTAWLKLDGLSEIGFILGDNLIATFEEAGFGFSVSQVNRIIERLEKTINKKG